jgi:DNA recombination protein RmuC
MGYGTLIETMTLTTFWAGFVLALAVAGVVGMAMLLWTRSQKAAVSEATKPLSDTLARIEVQMREFEAQRQHAQGGVDAQLTALSKDTVALSQALRGPNSRGRWGELTLKRVAELAGMAPYCDFFEQVSGDGRRPDMIVKLPGGRSLPVDAKAPLSAYLDAEAATDAPGRAAALDRHAQQLWRHVNELAAREYWGQFETAPEMVVLFLPGEHFLSAALERKQDLLDGALAKRVLIATPVTLVSVLKGVAYGWRQEKLAKNAEELRRIAGEFHERVRTFGEAYVDAGRHLQRATEAYNKSVASWDSRLVPSLKRMRELGVGGEPPQPAHIDLATRVPKPLDETGSDHPIV